MGLGEVADTVEAVDHANYDAHGKREDGVEDEFVEVTDDKQIDNQQFKSDVENLNVSIDVHLLVSDDGGVIGSLGDAKHGTEDATLIDPMRCGHSPFRDN